MATFRIVSADAHVLEPPHIWEAWLPAHCQDKAPKLVKDVDGGDAWQFAGSPDADPIGLVTTPGLPWDQFRWTGVTYDQARTGCYDGNARLADMDTDGVDAEILFPPQRTIGHFLGDEDDDFVRAGIDAYNNFLWDEFCAPDRARLVGMAQMPSTGVGDMIETLGKAKARGFKGVVISCWPSAGDGISDEDDAFWAVAKKKRCRCASTSTSPAAPPASVPAPPPTRASTARVTRHRRPTPKPSAGSPACSRPCPTRSDS